VGSNLSVKWPQGLLRTALGVVLVAAGITILNKANTDLVPYALAAAVLAFAALFIIQHRLRRQMVGDPLAQRRAAAERRAAEAEEAGEATPDPALVGVDDWPA
jgi:hypothetical protein